MLMIYLELIQQSILCIFSFVSLRPFALSFSDGINYVLRLQVSVVHVCEATLTKRLIEFENTDSGSLTVCSFLPQNFQIC
jgi:hypothetical protein